MKCLTWMLLLLSGLVGCEDDNVPESKVEGVVSDVQYFGDDSRRVVLTFEDERVVDLRILAGVVVFHKGKYHCVYYDSWGDITKVEMDK